MVNPLSKTKAQKARAKYVMKKQAITQRMVELRLRLTDLSLSDVEYICTQELLLHLSKKALELERNIECIDNPMRLIKI
jgi:hypothetical protein